jgi:hypothetical protein
MQAKSQELKAFFIHERRPERTGVTLHSLESSAPLHWNFRRPTQHFGLIEN